MKFVHKNFYFLYFFLRYGKQYETLVNFKRSYSILVDCSLVGVGLHEYKNYIGSGCKSVAQYLKSLALTKWVNENGLKAYMELSYEETQVVKNNWN